MENQSNNFQNYWTIPVTINNQLNIIKIPRNTIQKTPDDSFKKKNLFLIRSHGYTTYFNYRNYVNNHKSLFNEIMIQIGAYMIW